MDFTSVSSVTVTVQEALFPLPSAAVAVIFAVPFFTANTLPPLTVATFVRLLLHVTARLVAFVGRTVAESVVQSPSSSVMLVRFRETDCTETVLLTVTVMESLQPLPSIAVAVIFAVPAALA